MTRDEFLSHLRCQPGVIHWGHLTEVRGGTLTAELIGVALNEVVRVGGELRARVIGFRDRSVTLLPLQAHPAPHPGDIVEVESRREADLLPLPGSAVDGNGKVTLCGALSSARMNESPLSLSRRVPIGTRFVTGVRSLDALLPLGIGQRLALLAQPGCGKSILLGCFATHAVADHVVVAMIGERAREVTEFVTTVLNSSARHRTTVVAATSSDPPLAQVEAATRATAIAETYREQGCHVVLLVDSLTRLARAYRAVGLAAGEMPIRRGYPATVFQALPQLIERAGSTTKGAITAFYTLLLSSAVEEDPIVEEVKGYTDGHIVLSPHLATRGIYPAVSVPDSLSRVAVRFMDGAHARCAHSVRRLLLRLERDREMVLFGALPDPELARALQHEEVLFDFLKQDLDRGVPFEESTASLYELAERVGAEGLVRD